MIKEIVAKFEIYREPGPHRVLYQSVEEMRQLPCRNCGAMPGMVCHEHVRIDGTYYYSVPMAMVHSERLFEVFKALQ